MELVKQATPPRSTAKKTVAPQTAGLLIRSYSNFLTIDSGPCKPARCIPQGMQLARVQENGSPFYERDPRKAVMS